MPESLENPDSGYAIRSYDDLSDDNPDDIDQLKEVLFWMQDLPPLPVTSKKAKGYQQLQEISKAGKKMQEDDSHSIKGLKNELSGGNIVSQSVGIFANAFGWFGDLLRGKKVYSSLFNIGATVLFGGIGAVIGTFVLPGIGSAIGGAVGAAISGAAGIALTTIAGTIIGAWLGPKISQRIFKKEHPGLQNDKTIKKLKKIGVDFEAADAINQYLYNRTITAKSQTCSTLYNALREMGINQANPQAMEQITHFFCHEVTLLQKEIQNTPNAAELKHDLKGVQGILECLKKVRHFDNDTKRKIGEALHHIETFESRTHSVLPPEPVPPQTSQTHSSRVSSRSNSSIDRETNASSRNQTISFRSTPSSANEKTWLSEAQLTDLESRTHLLLSNPDVHITRKGEKHTSKDSVQHRYQILDRNNQTIASMKMVQQSVNQNVETQVSVKKNKINDTNQQIILSSLVAQAKAMAQTLGEDTPLVVMANGDDHLAVVLYAAALSANTKTELDDLEYPKNSPKRAEIIEKAQVLSESMRPRASSVGFKARNS